MLYTDVLRLISLYLNPFKLFICKELHDLYNDNWYFDKLTLLNPGINLYTSTNYEDLYQKSLRQGVIHVNHFYSSIKGIKVSSTTFFYLILTFNGDLIEESMFANGPILLMDQNVVDVCKDSYIKSYEWYVNYIKLDITPKNPFIKVLVDDGDMYYALTEQAIYYYNGETIKLFPIENCIDMYCNFYLYVLDDKNITHRLFCCTVSKQMVKENVCNVIVKYSKGLFDKNNNLLIDDDLLVSNFIEPYNLDEIDKYFLCQRKLIAKIYNNVHIYTINNDRLILQNIIYNVKDIFG